MNATRNNNASIVTAVICACLGVLVAGTPAYAHARRASAEGYRFESVSVIRSGFQAPVVSLRKLKPEGRWLPRPSAAAATEPQENLYRNEKPLTSRDQVLVVTRLARAGLSDSSAQPPKAF